MAEEGFKVATAYVALTVQDGDVQAQIERTVTSACEQAGQQGGSVLTEQIAAKVDSEAPALTEPLIESVAEAGQVSAEEWAAAMAMFDDSTRASGETLVATMAQSGAEAGQAAAEGLSVAEQELAAWRESVAEAAAMGANIAPAVTEALAQVESGAISAADAVKAIVLAESAAGESATLSERAFVDVATALRTVGTSSGLTLEQLRELAVGFDTARDGVDQYGTSEAQLAVSSQVLERAQAALADQNIALMQTYLLIGAGAPAEMQALQDALKGVADAQADVTAAASAQVDAVTAVNLALIQNTSASLDDETALRSMASAAEAAQVDLTALMEALEEGSYAALNEASAMAQAQLRSVALAEAEQQLAAANVTLLDTFQQVATGAEVSAEAQTAALEAVASAQRQVESLGGGKAAPLDATGASVGALGAEAKTASGEVAGLGGAMGGPLMGAVWMAMGVLPMLTYMFQGQSQAAQQAAQAQQALSQAISQDSNMVGANTVSVIANQLATGGAAQTLQGYGISLSEATAAMAGAKNAQDQVSGSLDAQITNLNALIQEQEAHTQNTDDEIDKERQQVQQLELTRDAMRQMEQDVVNAVAQQNDLTQATLFAEQAINVFNVQVRAGVLQLQQQAQQADVTAAALSAYLMTLTSGTAAYTHAVADQEVALAHNAVTARINAEALNESLPPQAQLSGAALDAAVSYQQASSATSAYTNSLTALYGQYGNTSQAQAAFTTALDGLSGSITKGKDAVDLNTKAGAANFTQFEQVAQAAENYSEKLYQQTGDAGQATSALQDMAGKLDTAAIKAGLTKDQVHQLNQELFGVPDVKDITIKLDPTPAEQSMATLDSFIAGEINSINNTPITPRVGSQLGYKPNATGGPVQAGVPVITGDGGRTEVFVPNSDGRIYPTVGDGVKAMAKQGWGGTTVHQHFYGTQWPSVEQTANMNRELAAVIGVA